MVDYSDPTTIAADYGPYALRLSQALAVPFTGWSFQ